MVTTSELCVCLGFGIMHVKFVPALSVLWWMAGETDDGAAFIDWLPQSRARFAASAYAEHRAVLAWSAPARCPLLPVSTVRIHES
jgi:hypothetical protein